LSVILP